MADISYFFQSKVAKIEETVSRQAEAVDDEADFNELLLDDLQNNAQMGYDSRQTPIQNQIHNSAHELMAQAARLSQQYNPYNTAYPMYMPPAYGPAALQNPTVLRGSMPPGVPAYTENPLLLQQQAAGYYTPPQFVQPQPPPPAPQSKHSSLEQALQTPTLLSTWNNTFNNQMVDKSPPVNVVITNSDPLPVYDTVPAQPKLSVTIPVQHIKHNQGLENITPPSNPMAQAIAPKPVTAQFSGLAGFGSGNTLNFGGLNSAAGTTPFGGTGKRLLNLCLLHFTLIFLIFSATIGNNGLLSVASSVTNLPVKSTPSATFSFGQLTTTTNSVISSVVSSSITTSAPVSVTAANTSSDTLEEPADYDPCPDFKPIIPLPAEVEVKTGEENETVMFSHRAKLFRMVDKEWKERGIGDIKILKSKTDGKYRVLMRREQVHKLCANHQITPEMTLKAVGGKQNQYIYAASDFAEEKLQNETFLVRFKEDSAGLEFKKAFEDAAKDMESK